MIGVLPDRERRHLLQFYFAPKIGYVTRLIWAGGLIAIGLAIQLVWTPDHLAPLLLVTLPLLIAGNGLLLVQGYNLKPTYNLARGKWEKTTRDRFQEVRTLQSEIDRWDNTFADITCAPGIVLLVVGVVIVAVAAAAMIDTDRGELWAPLFAVDAAVLLLPHWVTGTRRGWRPVSLRQQIDALDTVLAVIDRHEHPPCQIQPMFQVAGKQDAKTPTNARVFVRFPDGPEDFLGVQFQVAINDVQGTKYPYLYAVLVAQKSFKLRQGPLEDVRRRAKKITKPTGLLQFLGITKESGQLTIESKSEKDVDVIVIRQHTTKQTGYHTDPAAIRVIAEMAWSAASEIVEPAVV
ncbi:MAG: hypothetical protein CMJ58_24970 [Planctomycetaceae bacterium]|nr:hypothetical protein [Planctomycetaceae bacterium]